MVAFVVLGLVGGGLIAALMAIYLRYAFINLSKYDGGVWAFGHLFSVVGILFIYIPLSSFCVHTILKQDSNKLLSDLRLFWEVPWIVTTLFWMVKIAKKKEELRKKEPPKPEGPKKIKWI